MWNFKKKIQISWFPSILQNSLNWILLYLVLFSTQIDFKSHPLKINKQTIKNLNNTTSIKRYLLVPTYKTQVYIWLWWDPKVTFGLLINPLEELITSSHSVLILILHSNLWQMVTCNKLAASHATTVCGMWWLPSGELQTMSLKFVASGNCL